MATAIILAAILGLLGIGYILGSSFRKNFTSSTVVQDPVIETETTEEEDLEPYRERVKTLFRESVENSR
jgi:hypothetical protein